MKTSPVTDFKPTGDQQPAIHTTTLMATLPGEIYQRIFAEAGNPHASEVCREWRHLHDSAYVEIFLGYRKSELICPFMPTTTAPQTMEEYASIVKETAQRINSHYYQYFGMDVPVFANASLASSSLERIIQMTDQRKEDHNLILCFDRLSDEIPVGQRLIIREDLTVPDRAQFIRNWMQEHQELLNTVTVLDLANLNLSSLPREISNLVHLQGLSLYNNRFTVLSPAISHLVHLRTLSLGGNHLTVLPPDIGNLKKLEWLDLGNNQLTVLPPEIGHLVRLQALGLASNRLVVLPLEIGHLVHLQRLSLRWNCLTVLPPDIGHLVHLQRLDLIRNPLTIAGRVVLRNFQEQNPGCHVTFDGQLVEGHPVMERHSICTITNCVSVIAVAVLGISACAFLKYAGYPPG